MSEVPTWLKDIADSPQPVPQGPLSKLPPRLPKPPKGIKARNQRRAAKSYAKCFGVCSRMVREPDLFGVCVVPRCDRKDIQASHVRTRGAGGADWANVVALCPDHHHEQGAMGIRTFQAVYEIDLEQLAGLVALAVIEHSCAPRLDPHGRCRVCRDEP